MSAEGAFPEPFPEEAGLSGGLGHGLVSQERRRRRENEVCQERKASPHRGKREAALQEAEASGNFCRTHQLNPDEGRVCEPRFIPGSGEKPTQGGTSRSPVTSWDSMVQSLGMRRTKLDSAKASTSVCPTQEMCWVQQVAPKRGPQ